MNNFIQHWSNLITEENNDIESSNYKEDEVKKFSDLVNQDRKQFQNLFIQAFKNENFYEIEYKKQFEIYEKIVKPFIQSLSYKCWSFDELYTEIKEEWQNFEKFITFSEKPKTQDQCQFFLVPSDSSLYENGRWYINISNLLNDILNVEIQETYSSSDEFIKKFAKFIEDHKLIDLLLEIYDTEI